MKVLFVTAAVLVLATVLTSAVVALRTPLRRRWVWVIISLLGAPGLTLNWETSQLQSRVIIFQVLGVGFSKRVAPGAPWRLSVAFPLGAVLFLARRRNLVRRDSASAVAGAV
jgi:uncharacterized membrane protein (DUF441 family)